MLTLAAALVACVAFATPPAGRAAAVADAAAGKKVFTDNCTACHSATTNQTIAGPGLKGLFKNGKMPASGKPVTDANVRNRATFPQGLHTKCSPTHLAPDGHSAVATRAG